MTKQLALSAYRDPYTEWGKAHQERAAWAANYFAQMNRRMHLRGFHYWLVSLGTVNKPGGKPYSNTEGDWNWLQESVLQARYQQIGDWTSLLDKKHPEPFDHVDYGDWDDQTEGGGAVVVTDLVKERLESLVEDVVDDIMSRRPRYDDHGFQNYTLVLYCEKNTMNEVLDTIARRYGAIFQPLIGESSLERVDGVMRKAARRGKPVRVFYISDFDPSGKQMPVSVARKLEFLAKEIYDLDDVKLVPVVLTEEQVLKYKLPGVPTKPTDTKAAGFVAQYGDRATELDALEALHPGVLARLLTAAIRPYADFDGPRQVRDENDMMKQRVQAMVDDLRPALEASLGSLTAQGSFPILDLDAAIDPDWEMPQAEHQVDDQDGAPSDGPWLLDTANRDYDEQIEAYRDFKGGNGG